MEEIATIVQILLLVIILQELHTIAHFLYRIDKDWRVKAEKKKFKNDTDKFLNGGEG